MRFHGLRTYSRISQSVTISVDADDAVGITRVELYLDSLLIDFRGYPPGNPSVSTDFAWDSRTASNGKHILHTRAYNTTGESVSTSTVVLVRNYAQAVPPAATLTVTPSVITAGQAVTLNWTTTGAETVSLSHGIGQRPFSGSLTVTPLVSTTYVLTAANSAGAVTKTASVTVSGVPAGNNLVVNPSVTHQTMVGWEATDETGFLYTDPQAWNNYKNVLFDKAVDELGLNRIRLEIKSGIENPVDHFQRWRGGLITYEEYKTKRYEIINDNADPNSINPAGFQWTQLDSTIENVVLPLRERLVARGESLWINVNYVDFGSSPFEHKNSPAEYAEFVLATYQHMRSRYGIVPNSWEVILEPDAASAGWSTGQTANAIKAAGDQLLNNGFVPNFVAPSTLDAANAANYIDRIATTTGAMAYVGEFSYHRYAGGTTEILQGIAARSTKYHKRTAMSEWIGADYATLHQDLKVGRNSSWQQYTLGTNQPDNGAQYFLINDSNPQAPSVTFASQAKFLRQYFKFIRAGAVRVEASTSNASFDPVAFVNNDGRHVVVVKAASGGTFTIQGLPAGRYGIKFTTASQFDQNLPAITVPDGHLAIAAIPAGGVITLYGM